MPLKAALIMLVLTACTTSDEQNVMNDPVHEPDIERAAFFNVPINRGHSPRLELQLPEDIISLTVTVHGESDVQYCVNELRNPWGTPMVSPAPEGIDLNQFHHNALPWPGPYLSPNRSACFSDGIATLLVPNNPQVHLSPGVFEMGIGAQVNGAPVNSTVDVLVHLNRRSIPVDTQVLGLHLFFTGAKGWSAQTAQQDEEFNEVLERVATIYARVGIDVQVSSWNDVAETHANVSTARQANGADTNVGQLLSLNPYDHGVAVFLVDFLSDEVGGPLAGLSNSTPGAPLQGHTPSSGIIVSTRLESTAQGIAHIMAHELGHFLGLFHTEEINGVHRDQLGDTPMGREAMNNLMYPGLDVEQSSLSDEQTWVMGLNPVMERLQR